MYSIVLSVTQVLSYSSSASGTYISLQRHRKAALKDHIYTELYLAFTRALQCSATLIFTCLPLWMRFLRRTGVLPVVTHTPASVLL